LLRHSAGEGSPPGASRRLVVDGPGERERRSLRVAADHPALARVDDLAAERLYVLDRGGEVCNGEVREREAIARAGAALVQANHDAIVLGLPAVPFFGSTFGECRFEQPLPEPASAFRFVGGKLDEEARRHVPKRYLFLVRRLSWQAATLKCVMQPA
jgi:hypothetical protein